MRRDNSYERRRKRHALVKEWTVRLHDIEDEVRQELGLGTRPHRSLAFEILVLGSTCVPGFDVVIPAFRDDLARRYIEARLVGVRPSRELYLAIAPLPNEHLIPYYDARRKVTRWRSTAPRQDAATRILTWWVQDMGRRTRRSLNRS